MKPFLAALGVTLTLSSAASALPSVTLPSLTFPPVPSDTPSQSCVKALDAAPTCTTGNAQG